MKKFKETVAKALGAIAGVVLMLNTLILLVETKATTLPKEEVPATEIRTRIIIDLVCVVVITVSVLYYIYINKKGGRK